ncbi:MAG: hypothetical protein ACOX5R_22330 [bacterium]|jgi:hypothetical protein
MWIIVLTHVFIALALYVNSRQYVHSPAGAVKWSALGLCTGLIGAGIWSCWFRGDRCVYSKINIVLITMVVEAALVYTGVAFFLLP